MRTTVHRNLNILVRFDMPVPSEVQMNLTNFVCEGQSDLYKEDVY